ncbi:hypothetical protein Tco_0385537 [Tanacetum coccineum]
MSVVSPEGSAANVHDEELKMVVDGPVANNDVGSEVVPPSAGRRWRGILARRVLPSSDVDSKGSATNVPDEKLKMVVAGPVANNVVGVEGSAANVPDEELEIDVAGLVANNAVGAEVVPPSVGSTKESMWFWMRAPLILRKHVVHRILKIVIPFFQEKAMLVGRSQALREVASSGISVKLVDMKDFDPNAKQNYDRAIESFYQVKFPYVDLLVHYAGQSMGKLMTLKPPIISFRNASAAGPSASPFL